MAKLTNDEMIFAQRMLPHFLAGKSVEDCAKAVLDDDIRLFSALCDRQHSDVAPGYNDHTGRSYLTREGKGDLIANEMASTVYERLRAA